MINRIYYFISNNGNSIDYYNKKIISGLIIMKHKKTFKKKFSNKMNLNQI